MKTSASLEEEEFRLYLQRNCKQSDRVAAAAASAQSHSMDLWCKLHLTAKLPPSLISTERKEHFKRVQKLLLPPEHCRGQEEEEKNSLTKSGQNSWLTAQNLFKEAPDLIFFVQLFKTKKVNCFSQGNAHAGKNKQISLLS